MSGPVAKKSAGSEVLEHGGDVHSVDRMCSEALVKSDRVARGGGLAAAIVTPESLGSALSARGDETNLVREQASQILGRFGDERVAHSVATQYLFRTKRLRGRLAASPSRGRGAPHHGLIHTRTPPLATHSSLSD